MTQDTDLDISAYLDSIEKTGATLTSPHINEGNYKGTILEISSQAREFQYKKGPKIGEDGVLTTWQVKLAVDSETARSIMKRDNDVIVYADQDTINLQKGFLTVDNNGISFSENLAFWSFIGSILEPVELASKLKDDSGSSSYVFTRPLLNDIFHGVQELKTELKENPEIKPLLIPSMVAALQLKNLSELICSEKDTSQVYLHIALRKKRIAGNPSDAPMQHFVKNIIIPSVFEEREENVASLIL